MRKCVIMSSKCSWYGVAVALVFLVGGIALTSCKKDEKEVFNIVRKWRVERVTVRGAETLEHSMVGAVYEFTESGKCYVTMPGASSPLEYDYVFSAQRYVLQISSYFYAVYLAEGDELTFGWIVDGVDFGTYHLVEI